MEDAEVSIISKHMVRPSPRSNGGGGEERKPTKIIHLPPCDLKMLQLHYTQEGILFHKPPNQPTDLIISKLLSSFSRALDHYYPLAGRFRTAHHPDENSISVSLHCTDQGAEFVHASAPNVKISDILAPGFYIPTIVVNSFFPLNGITSHDGHTDPLIGVQVTELADGVFVACSLNHAAADGNSFWRFFNAWSDICRNGIGNNEAVESPLDFERWFPDSVTPPVRLPFNDYQQFVRLPELRMLPVLECMFHFSSANVKRLKARVNEEMGCGDKISSLQALTTHLWRSVSRARALKPEQGTTCFLPVGFRSRLNPPLPETYLGNSNLSVSVKVLAGEIESKGLGWTAWRLNEAIASMDEGSIRSWSEAWSRSPSLTVFDVDAFSSLAALVIANSPRFEVYGNDFRWGRPVAVRSGPGNKVDGQTMVYPGVEEGSIDMEVCLQAKVLNSLLQDAEFMEVVS